MSPISNQAPADIAERLSPWKPVWLGRPESTNGVGFSKAVISGLFGFADACAMCGTGLVLHLYYIGPQIDLLLRCISMTILGAALLIAAFASAGLYKIESLALPVRRTRGIVARCAIVFIAVAIFAIGLGVSDAISREWAISWLFTATLAIYLARLAGGSLLTSCAKSGLVTRNMVVIGAGEQCQKLIGELAANRDDPWLKLVGVFDDRTERSPGAVCGVPVIGRTSELAEFARRTRVDDVLIALPWTAEGRILELLNKLKCLPAHIELSPSIVVPGAKRWAYEPVGRIPCLRVSANPLAGWNAVLKAAEDRILASVLMLIALPLMVTLAVVVRLDTPGPVLFRQKRYGFNGKLIEVFKFRTMYVAPDPDDGSVQATRNDPRVTRVGRFLRRTSLDELPQLFNVLRGEMSIVGPRPHPLALDDKFSSLIDSYLGRHRVKPGITGWAQVNGWRGETDTFEKMKNRVEHDLEYIENWSISWDLYIIMKTIWVVIRGSNAY